MPIQNQRLYKKLNDKIDHKTGLGANKVIGILDQEMKKAETFNSARDVVFMAEEVFGNVENVIWKRRVTNFINYLYFKLRDKK